VTRSSVTPTSPGTSQYQSVRSRRRHVHWPALSRTDPVRVPTTCPHGFGNRSDLFRRFGFQRGLMVRPVCAGASCS
jgi:hypothetical protein